MNETKARDRAETIDRQLPSLLNDGESLPEDLLGATILQIGIPSKQGRNGGLVVVYKSADNSKVRRLVLRFTDCKMWIAARA